MALNGTPPPNITTSSLNHGSYKIDDISNTKTGATISRYTDLDGHNNGLIDTQLSFNYQGFEYRRDEDERPTQPLTTTYKKIDIAAEQRFEQNNGSGANPAITNITAEEFNAKAQERGIDVTKLDKDFTGETAIDDNNAAVLSKATIVAGDTPLPSTPTPLPSPFGNGFDPTPFFRPPTTSPQLNFGGGPLPPVIPPTSGPLSNISGFSSVDLLSISNMQNNPDLAPKIT